jgi:hypothetical protein
MSITAAIALRHALLRAENATPAWCSLSPWCERRLRKKAVHAGMRYHLPFNFFL